MKHSNDQAISCYISYVSFKPQVTEFLNKNFILPRIGVFFENKRGDGHDIWPIDRDSIVSEVDWSLDYVYNILLNELQKDEQGKIKHYHRYTITFDVDLAPYESEIRCPVTDTNIKYGQITLGEVPVFYYIYIDLQEMLRFLKKEYKVVHKEISPFSPESQQKIVRDNSKPQISQELLRIWEAVLNIVKQKRPSLAVRLHIAIPVRLTQDSFIIGFHQYAEFTRKSIEEQKNITILSEALQEYLGRTIQVVTTTHNEAVSIETMRKELKKLDL